MKWKLVQFSTEECSLHTLKKTLKRFCLDALMECLFVSSLTLRSHAKQLKEHLPGHGVKYVLDHGPLDLWTIFGLFFGPFLGLNFGLFLRAGLVVFSWGWFIICSSSGKGR